jgi:hypothetical protein
MANKRIYDLTAATDLTDQFLAIDKSGNSEAEKLSTNGFIQYTKQTLSSVQIKAANTSPVTLITAKGSGKYIYPIRVVEKFNYVSAAYVTSTFIDLGYNSNIDSQKWWNIYIGGTSNTFVNLDVNSNYTILENDAFIAKARTADPTAGDSTLDIYIWYLILDA